MSALVPLILMALLTGTVTPAQEGGDRQLTLTVYNQDFGVVRDEREVNLPTGLIEHHFTDVAAKIDPTSVQLISVTDPNALRVVEQNYQYDLVSAETLLEKYIDQPLQVVLADGRVVEGVLLSFEAGKLTLKLSPGSLQVIARNENLKRIVFGALPAGLLTRPTLLWRLDNRHAGPQTVQVVYQTSGLNWHVDYTLIVDDANHERIDLSGWVTIQNQSGASYPDANLKLVAGEVHKAKPEELRRAKAAALLAEGLAGGAEPQFEEKAFAEYHLYTLRRRSSILQNQTKQIELLKVGGIPVRRIYLFEEQHFPVWRTGGSAAEAAEPLKVQLIFKNDQTSHLGIPLPKGRIRIYRRDDEGSLQLIGTDTIDHTPKDEEVKVTIGRSFEVLGRRTVMEYKWISKSAHVERIRIELRNHKAEQIRAKVIERFVGRADWEIRQASDEYRKEDFRTISFTVDLPPNSEKIIEYRVQYGGQADSGRGLPKSVLPSLPRREVQRRAK